MTISREVKERVKRNYPSDRLSGMNSTKIAEKYGIHRNTLNKWLQEWGYTHYGWRNVTK